MNGTIFQTIADETVRHLAATNSLQDIFPVKVEAKLWTAVASGEKTLVVSVRPPWKSPIDLSALRRIVGRTATAFVYQSVGDGDRPTDVAAKLYETLTPAVEGVRAYRYSDVWR